jgi:hypothetical protein
MLAGRWADDIRQNPDYDRPMWHYINYPFVPDAAKDRVPPSDPVEPNIVTAFEYNLGRLKNAPDEVEKAVALTWLFHLIGDIHMPLHATALFKEEFPTGDRGGTRFYIKAEGEGDAINLHYF